MSKHIDLLAVGALLLAFAIGAHLHAAIRVGVTPAQLLRIRAINPVVVVPPHFPAVPHVPHFPRV